MIKIDLKLGFHQLPLAKSSYNHNGICYKGVKYSLTRLPMGHALAPISFSTFRRSFFGRSFAGAQRGRHRLSGRLAAALSLRIRLAYGSGDDWSYGYKHSDQSEKARRTAEILCAVLSIPTPPTMFTRYDTMQFCQLSQKVATVAMKGAEEKAVEINVGSSCR